jgi:hypothetical protein
MVGCDRVSLPTPLRLEKGHLVLHAPSAMAGFCVTACRRPGLSDGPSPPRHRPGWFSIARWPPAPSLL